MSNIPSESDQDQGRSAAGRRGRLAWRQRPWLVGISLILSTFSVALLVAAWEARYRSPTAVTDGEDTDTDSDANSSDASQNQPALFDTSPSFGVTSGGFFSHEDRARQAVAQQLQHLNEQLQQTHETWTQLDQDARKWNDAPGSLLSPEEGRKLASDPRSVSRLMVLLDRDRPSIRDLEVLGKRLRTFEEVVKKIPLDESHMANDVARHARSLMQEFDSARSVFVRDEAELKELERFARIGSDEGASLEDALRSARLELATKALETRLREMQEEAEAEAERLVAEAKRVIRREEEPHVQKARNERDRIRSEKEQLEDEVLAQAIDRERERIMQMLRDRFDLEYPRMRKYLVGFTSDGYMQFAGGYLRTVTKKGPISYSGMIEAGILNEGTPSVGAFYGRMTANNPNDRDMGAFPPYGGGAQDFDDKFPLLLAIQTFLRAFGPVMVERGLLAP